jgi:hypothetical protein
MNRTGYARSWYRLNRARLRAHYRARHIQQRADAGRMAALGWQERCGLWLPRLTAAPPPGGSR